MNIRKFFLVEGLPNQMIRDSNTSKNEIVKVEKYAIVPASPDLKKGRKENQMKPDFLVHKLLQTICSVLFVVTGAKIRQFKRDTEGIPGTLLEQSG